MAHPQTERLGGAVRGACFVSSERRTSYPSTSFGMAILLLRSLLWTTNHPGRSYRDLISENSICTSGHPTLCRTKFLSVITNVRPCFTLSNPACIPKELNTIRVARIPAKAAQQSNRRNGKSGEVALHASKAIPSSRNTTSHKISRILGSRPRLDNCFEAILNSGICTHCNRPQSR